MFKICIAISLLIIVAFILSGCGVGSEALIDPLTSLESTIANEPQVLLSPAPSFQASLGYSNLDGLLRDIALVRFDEPERFYRSYHFSFVLREIRELYMPHNIPENFPLSRIIIGVNRMNDPIDFSYRLPGGFSLRFRYARFVWNRNRPTDEVFFRGGREAHGPYSGEEIRHHWSQYGYEFEAFIPERFPEEEAYDLTVALLNAQPVVSWEIQGNAIMVSVQGMENVVILNEEGYEIVSEVTIADMNFLNIFSLNHHSLSHHTLYLTPARIGYSWLVCADSSRYQYVLKPGTYTFHVEGVTGEPDLLIRHFADREIVSSVSFGAELAAQPFSSFTVTITPELGSGDILVIEP